MDAARLAQRQEELELDVVWISDHDEVVVLDARMRDAECVQPVLPPVVPGGIRSEVVALVDPGAGVETTSSGSRGEAHEERTDRQTSRPIVRRIHWKWTGGGI